MTTKRQVKKENMKKKPVCSSVAETATADHVQEMLRGIPNETVGIVLCLCRLSYRGFFDWHEQNRWKKDPKIIFTDSDLTQCDIEVTNNFDGFGLLKVTETHQLSTDINTYNFNHLTIQEFLCAIYITSLPQQEQLCLLREHFDDYRNVFTFVCGLTGLASSEMFQLIYSKLTSYSIDNKGAEMFHKHYTNKTTTCQLLEELNLSFNELTSEGMDHMMKIVKTNSATLRVLNVSENDIGDDGMAVISEALQNNKSLTTLDVSLCWLSVKGAKYISQLLNVTHTLQELNIAYNDIGDDGIAVISEALQHNKSLTTLRVYQCGLSAKGAISISNMMMVNHSLQELNMNRNSIGDDGISAIVRGLGTCKINELDVRGCGITLTGARSLAPSLSSQPTIRGLWLQGNLITAEGAQLIVEAAVNNTVCLQVYIDDEYKNDKVKEMLSILEKRREQERLLQQQEVSREINSNNSSDEEPIVPLPIIAGGGQTVHLSMDTSLMSPTEDDNHSGGGWEEQ